MTLKEFFELLAANPVFILAFFILIPLAALLAGFLGKGEGALSPWKYLYSSLIYLVCVPGLFAVSLSVYLFMFEHHSVFDTDIYTQVLPVLSMIVTLLIISKNVDLERIPGFDKLSGLMLIIVAILTIMWILDKTRILVFSYLPFQYVILLFVLLLVLIRLGWIRLMRKPASGE